MFAVVDCGFSPRCAQEEIGSGDIRLQKIERIIEHCKFGIHDLSNMELDKKSGLPRFNMPLELGLFIGAKRYGDSVQKKKKFIILDREPYRYQQAISDISGQDISAHQNDPERAISEIRDWLKNVSKRKSIPGGRFVIKRYRTYEQDYPAICRSLRYDEVGLPFNDLWETMTEWQKLHAEAQSSS